MKHLFIPRPEPGFRLCLKLADQRFHAQQFVGSPVLFLLLALTLCLRFLLRFCGSLHFFFRYKSQCLSLTKASSDDVDTHYSIGVLSVRKGLAESHPKCGVLITAFDVLLVIFLVPQVAYAASTCYSVSATNPLSFGTYTGTTLTPSTATVTLTCPASSAYAVGLSAGTSTGATVTTRKMTSGSSSLSYGMYRDSAHTMNWGNTNGVDTNNGTTGSGTTAVLTIYAVLAAGQYPAPGYYSDTITTNELAGAAASAFSVSVTVQATCMISVTPLAFGTYSGAALNVNATITATCTSTTPYNVGLSAGNSTGATVTTRSMTSPGGVGLGYTLFRDSAKTLNWGNTVSTDTLAGTGSGTTQSLTVYGRMAAGQPLTSPATYSDTVIVTLTY